LLFRQSANQPANQANQHKRVADNRLHPFKDIHLILLQLPPPLQQPTNQHTQQASFFFSSVQTIIIHTQLALSKVPNSVPAFIHSVSLATLFIIISFYGPLIFFLKTIFSISARF
jgi:hypothetical protein